jgi:hypothetical protein
MAANSLILILLALSGNPWILSTWCHCIIMIVKYEHLKNVQPKQVQPMSGRRQKENMRAHAHRRNISIIRGIWNIRWIGNVAATKIAAANFAQFFSAFGLTFLVPTFCL